jgi:hypothetical protein
VLKGQDFLRFHTSVVASLLIGDVESSGRENDHCHLAGMIGPPGKELCDINDPSLAKDAIFRVGAFFFALFFFAHASVVICLPSIDRAFGADRDPFAPDVGGTASQTL